MKWQLLTLHVLLVSSVPNLKLARLIQFTFVLCWLNPWPWAEVMLNNPWLTWENGFYAKCTASWDVYFFQSPTREDPYSQVLLKQNVCPSISGRNCNSVLGDCFLTTRSLSLPFSEPNIFNEVWFFRYRRISIPLKIVVFLFHYWP